MVKLLLRILNVVALSVLSIILSFNLYSIFASVVLKQNPPQIFGFSNAVIISGSMEPDINVNDMVIIKSQKEYRINDIVTYRDNDTLVTHKLVGIENGEYITKGVSNNTEDSAVSKEQIVGKVIWVIPYIGNIIEFLKSPFGMMILILVAGAILFFPSRLANSRKE